jgi:hypothetical protein
MVLETQAGKRLLVAVRLSIPKHLHLLVLGQNLQEHRLLRKLTFKFGAEEAEALLVQMLAAAAAAHIWNIGYP